MRLVVAAADGFDHPNELGSPVCDDHKHARPNDGPLDPDHRRDMGRLDD